jgi:hypothetical protein
MGLMMQQMVRQHGKGIHNLMNLQYQEIRELTDIQLLLVKVPQHITGQHI